MDLSQLMADDSAKQAVYLPSDDELKTVGELANEQLRLEALVAVQEQALKELKEQLAQVREFTLPAALEAFGMMSITLLDKTKVNIKEDVYAGITEENREAAFEWLEATENDGIIKNEVKCPFGKGQDAEAKRLVDLLSSQGYSFVNTRTVHPQTLKAFVRKQLEEGLPVPTDVFSIHIKKVASIELPKKR
jgi:hypothetical protein